MRRGGWARHGRLDLVKVWSERSNRKPASWSLDTERGICIHSCRGPRVFTLYKIRISMRLPLTKVFETGRCHPSSSHSSAASAQPQPHRLPSFSPPTRKSRASAPSRQHLAAKSSPTVTSSPIGVQDKPVTSLLCPRISAEPCWYMGIVSSRRVERPVPLSVRVKTGLGLGKGESEVRIR